MPTKTNRELLSEKVKKEIEKEQEKKKQEEERQQQENLKYPWDNDPDIMVDNEGKKYSKDNLVTGIMRFSLFTGLWGNYGDFTFVPTGATPFKGMSREQKMRACGIVSNTMSGTQVKNAGLLTNVTLDQTRGKYSGLINKAVANDLANICAEICKLGFFDMQISNTFREQNTVSGGVSKHCWGVALDINPTRGCPWFAAHIPRDFREPAYGSNPPWGFKKYSCGTYDRAKCIWSFDHPVVRIFEGHGWGWGGRYGDTMHFSLFDGA